MGHTMVISLVDFNRYKEALVSLVTHVLQRLQFRFNQSQLEEMDDETLDDEVSAHQGAPLTMGNPQY